MLQELLSSNRFKSLLWRTGAMALAFVLSASLVHLDALQLSTQQTVFIGLVIGEITKAINNYLNTTV